MTLILGSTVRWQPHRPYVSVFLLTLSALTIDPQWPYTGRRYNSSFMTGPMMHPGPMGGGGFDEDPSSPHAGPPHLMSGMPPNFPPYGYRFQVSCLVYSKSST